MWYYKDKSISSLEDMPKEAIGFVYYIKFTDNTKYIGKKNLYSIQTLPSLKKGKRDNIYKQIFKNTGKGFRKSYDVIRKESNWLKYQGSAKECKDKEVAYKRILAYAYSDLELTYLETYYLFLYKVLFKQEFINDNILGKFYRSKLNETSNTFTSNTS